MPGQISGARVVELEDEQDPLVGDWLRLYEAAFPPEEKVPAEEHLAVLRARTEGRRITARLLGVLGPDGSLTGIARYDLLEECPAAYLMYLAVAEELRGTGIGTGFYRHLLDALRREDLPPRALLFEVERPDHAASEEGHHEAERRIHFYRRLGAQLLEGIHYVQKVPGHLPVPMHLMVHPLAAPLDAEEAFGMCAAAFGATRAGTPLQLV